jgi:hypothetical protein
MLAFARTKTSPIYGRGRKQSMICLERVLKCAGQARSKQVKPWKIKIGGGLQGQARAWPGRNNQELKTYDLPAPGGLTIWGLAALGGSYRQAVQEAALEGGVIHPENLRHRACAIGSRQPHHVPPQRFGNRFPVFALLAPSMQGGLQLCYFRRERRIQFRGGWRCHKRLHEFMFTCSSTKAPYSPACSGNMGCFTHCPH